MNKKLVKTIPRPSRSHRDTSMTKNSCNVCWFLKQTCTGLEELGRGKKSNLEKSEKVSDVLAFELSSEQLLGIL